MRMRSQLPAAPADVPAAAPAAKHRLPLPLQPLGRKDAETLCGVIDTVATAIAAVSIALRWHLQKCRRGSLVVVMVGGRSTGSPLPPLGVHMIDAR